MALTKLIPVMAQIGSHHLLAPSCVNAGTLWGKTINHACCSAEASRTPQATDDEARATSHRGVRGSVTRPFG